MKIIDILNTIARGEEPPKKIYYNYDTYVYDFISKDYRDVNSHSYISEYAVNDGFGRFLNDEVEILQITIHNKKKIEKLEDSFEYQCDNEEKVSKSFTMAEWVLKEKINEIIDHIQE